MQDTKNKVKAETKNKRKIDYNIKVEEMANAGILFGRRNSKTNPGMRPYIEKIRETIAIIDLEKTAEKLREALAFVESLAEQGKTILIIGTKIPLKGLVEKFAQECNLSYVNERWIGGALTNFDEILKRIRYLKSLELKTKTREFEKYTKKEKIKTHRELMRLTRKFGGIKELEKLPDVIFVLDVGKNVSSIKEARKMGIKVIAIVNTDVNPSLCDYFIPANDNSISSVNYILERMKKAILERQSKQPRSSEADKAKSKMDAK